MGYTPDLDWVDDAPPGFDTERMNKMQLGIRDAAQVADTASATAAQALSDAAAAQSTADEALAAVGSGGVHTVDDDVKRIYRAGTTPPDGVQPGDLVITSAPSAAGPASIPDLLTWVDAAATGARDLSTMLPDVSGNGADLVWRDVSSAPASVSALNGLPAFRFNKSAYWNYVGNHTGPRTISGVASFTGGVPATDQTLVYTGGTLALDLGVRATSGNLYLSAESSTVYDAPLAWAGGVAYVSFIIALDSQVQLWLGGQLVATAALTSGGDRGSLVLSRLTNQFEGVVGEFAEHEGHAVEPAEAAALAGYYRAKWRV